VTDSQSYVEMALLRIPSGANGQFIPHLSAGWVGPATGPTGKPWEENKIHT